MYAEQDAATPSEADQLDTVPTELPPLPTPVGDHDHAAQLLWERRQVFEGLWRYARSRIKQAGRNGEGGYVERSLAEQEPGQVIAMQVISPLAELIAAAQVEANAAMADPKNKKTSAENWVLLSLAPEVLAVVTVLSALSHAEGTSVAAACKAIAKSVKNEWDLKIWKDREDAAEKQREELGAEWEPNLARLMYKRNDVVDERVFTKWAKKAPQFMASEWSQEQSIQVGACLLHQLMNAAGANYPQELRAELEQAALARGEKWGGPGHKVNDTRPEWELPEKSGVWFMIMEAEERPGKTVLKFQLTPWARTWVSKRHNQNGLARPYMLPMICEPLDYEYIEPTTPDGGAEAAEEVA